MNTTQFEFSADANQPQNILEGENFIKADLGDFTEIKGYAMVNNELGMKNEGKIFLHTLLKLTGAEASLNSFPAGFEAPFKHAHKNNEELYVILSGKGIIEIDGEAIEVKEGSVLNVKPNGVRLIKNNSDDELIMLIVQTAQNSLAGYTLTDAIIK